MTTVNPFSQSPIEDPKNFHDRDFERGFLRDYLSKGMSCQIVGQSGIGKTSLLKCLPAFAREWDGEFVVAYLDMNREDLRTVEGFVCAAMKEWGLLRPSRSFVSESKEVLLHLSRLADAVVDLRAQGKRPVLCLDDFDALSEKNSEFDPDFYIDLRSIAREGLSFVTASQRSLVEFSGSLSERVSPFFNIFSTVYLGPFSDDDAHDFVTIKREGVEPFTAEERNVILEFAAGYPLKLQTACFEVLEAKRKGDSTASAIVKAMNAASLHTAA